MHAFLLFELHQVLSLENLLNSKVGVGLGRMRYLLRFIVKFMRFLFSSSSSRRGGEVILFHSSSHHHCLPGLNFFLIRFGFPSFFYASHPGHSVSLCEPPVLSTFLITSAPSRSYLFIDSLPQIN
jgi:hypothetical protein